MSTLQVFDMTCVQNLVGRLKGLELSQSSRARETWAMIDRSREGVYVPELVEGPDRGETSREP